MPLTENELRDLLHQRSDGAPASPDRVGAVRTRVAKQRRRELAAVSGALALVVAAGALWALPRNSATPIPPASPTPTVSDGSLVIEQDLNGVRMRTIGPAAIAGEGPFTLRLEVTNPGTQEWKGELGVGLVHAPLSAAVVDSGLLLPVDAAAEAAPDVLTSLLLPLDDGRLFDGATTAGFVTIPAGQASTWSVQVRRNMEIPVVGPVTGWVAYAAPGSAVSSPAPARFVGDRAVAIDIEPRGSTLACSEVSELTWEKSAVQQWRLGSAEQVTVEQDGATPVIGDATVSDLVEIRLERDPGAVPSWAVLIALDSAGTGASTTSGLSAPTMNPEAFTQAGTYVLYSAASMVDVRFAGTCLPSGEPVSGTAALYGDGAVSGGIVDCATGPDATPAARLAAAYCKTT